MASASRVIYIGMTNSLEKRVLQHKQKETEGFTKKYDCTKLVWLEHFRDVRTPSLARSGSTDCCERRKSRSSKRKTSNGKILAWNCLSQPK
jgi:predicted GIY-YIG superfamily endonuclease